MNSQPLISEHTPQQEEMNREPVAQTTRNPQASNEFEIAADKEDDDWSSSGSDQEDPYNDNKEKLSALPTDRARQSSPVQEDKGQRVILDSFASSARRQDSSKLPRDSEDEFDEDDRAASEDGAFD